MDHRKLRESETQYERAMNRYIKECDNHMIKEKEKKKQKYKGISIKYKTGESNCIQYIFSDIFKQININIV